MEVLQCYKPHKIERFCTIGVLQRCYKGATGCYERRLGFGCRAKGKGKEAHKQHEDDAVHRMRVGAASAARWLGGDLSPCMQKLRCEIGLIRPHQRVQVGVHPELAKIIHRLERLENLAIKLRSQVHLTLNPS